jgi:hypothetical protein
MLQKMYLTASQALVYRSVNVAKLSAKMRKQMTMELKVCSRLPIKAKPHKLGKKAEKAKRVKDARESWKT